MRILQINAVNGILSTGKITQEMAEVLTEAGCENYIAYAYGIAEQDHTFKIGNIIDRKIHAILSRITGLQGYYSYLTTFKLIQKIKKIRPDIIHLHNMHSNYIQLNLLLKFLAKNDIATVITLHDCWFFTGRCFHYTVNQCYQWQTCCYKCPNSKNTMPSWFFDRSKKMFLDKQKYFNRINNLAVIGVSDWILNEAGKSFLSNALIKKRIYNWVNLGVFKPMEVQFLREELRLDNKFIIMGIAAFWGESKGLQDFIKLAEIFKEDSAVILVGEIKNKSELPPQVILIPQTSDNEKLAQLYSLSDVLVSLSKEESFGKVIIEGFACGTPAVVYPLTASPELIHNKCGWIAKDITLPAVVEGISQIKENKKSYYTKACRKYAEENFDMHRCIFEYLEIYKELMYQKKQ